MKIEERMIQQVHMDKWPDLEILEKRWVALENRLGFPPKRRLQAIAGSQTMGTLIIEREWDCLAQFETMMEKQFADPEFQQLNAETGTCIGSVQLEFYQVL